MILFIVSIELQVENKPMFDDELSNNDSLSKYIFEYTEVSQLFYKVEDKNHSLSDIWCNIYYNKKSKKRLMSYSDGKWIEFNKYNYSTRNSGNKFTDEVSVSKLSVDL